MKNENSNFGKRQAIHDLLGTTNHSVLTDNLGEQFSHLWEHKCWPEFQSPELLAQLEELAGGDDFCPATISANAVLLICCLCDDNSTINLTWNWEAHRDGFRQLPRLQRAAFLNGFTRLRMHGRFEWGDPDAWGEPFPPEEGHTFSVSEITKPLLANIKASSNEELEAVARGDRHSSFEKHLAALRDLIWKFDGAANHSHNWYPMESVDLTGYSSGVTGYELAAALILMNELVGSYAGEHTAVGWYFNADFIVQLPKNIANPLIAGYRYLYETDLEWNPYEMVFKGVTRKMRPLPLVVLKASDASQIITPTYFKDLAPRVINL